MAMARAEGQTSDIWWVFLLQGLAAVLLGIMLLAEPGATMVGVVTVLGLYWMVTGIFSLVRIFVDHSVPWIWSLISGAIGIMAGVWVLNHPLLAGLTLPTVVAVMLGVQGLVMGTIEIVHAFSGGGFGSFVLGAINGLMGLFLLSSPVQAALVVPVVFGFLLVMQGILVSIWAIRLHQMVGEVRLALAPERSAQDAHLS
jgi:uncharacterized membrane protein HdeD (DUF308 family)